MKVAFLAMGSNFDTNKGQGVQKHIYEIFRHLSSAEGSHFSIDKVALGSGSVDFTLLELVHSFFGYDLIHTPCPIGINPLLRNCPIITTLHELVVHDNSNEYLSKVKVSKIPNVIGSLIKVQIFTSDYLFANSTQTCSEAISQGYPKERIFIVNHAIDDMFLSAIPKKKESQKFKVGYMGSHGERKNTGFLVKTMGYTSNNVIMEIYGQGPRNSNKRIQNKGFVPENKKVEAYDSFDCFLFPSYYEGFGLPILEAQARGLPVIIYKDAKISEEVRRYCLEARDPSHAAQIIELLKSNGYAKDRRSAAIKYARSFNWVKCTKETIEVYNKIAKK